MERLIRFCVERSFLVNLVVGFICVAGLLVTLNMKRDLVPPFEFQIIEVRASVPGASPSEIEEYVAYPIEDTLRGLPGVEKVSSSSSNGQLNLTLVFKPSFERINETLEQVKAMLISLRPRLPDSLKTIDVTRVREDRVFLFWMALKNFDEENVAHRQLIRKFEKTVQKVEGVVLVNAEIRPRDLYIEFDARKIEEYNLSISEIREGIEHALSMTPLGQLADNEATLSFELPRVSKTPEDLASLPVAGNRTGNVIRLKDVARIGYKLTAQSDLYYLNGEPSLGLEIEKDTTSDSIDLKAIVDKKIAEFNATLPVPLKIEPVVDGPRFIVQQLNVLYQNGVWGTILVFAILFVFLNFRASLMTVWGVPVSYFGAMIVLSYMGISIDLISIIGLILVVGILVDDAIIISERYMENLESGMVPKEAAVAAVKDLWLPVTGTVMTTVVAFAPVLLIKSEMGIILRAIPIVIITSLLFSLLECFFALPNHLAHFVPTVKKTRRDRFFEVLKRGYKRALQFTIRWRYPALILLLVLSGATGYIATNKLKQNFNLSVNSEKVVIYPILKKSNSPEETYKKIKAIEDYAMTLPKSEVASVTSWVGGIWQDGKNQRGYRFSQVTVYLHADEKYPTKVKERLKVQIEAELAKFRNDEFESIEVKERKHGDDRSKKNLVSVRIRGGDEVEFKQLEDEIAQSALKAEGIIEKVAEDDRYQTAWKFVPDPDALLRYNFKLSDFEKQIKGLLVPDEIIETRANGEKLRIYTKMQSQVNLEFKNLQRLEIVSANGVRVPLKRLGEWREVQALAEIAHYNGERSLTVDFKFDEKKTNTTKAKTDIELLLASVLQKYPSHQIEVTDSDENEANSRAWAIRVALICLLSVFVVLSLVLGSLTQPFLVALPIPFGIIGIIWSLYLHNLPLGLMALIGLVAVIGISVNDSIVMVDQINKLSAKFNGLSRFAIIEGATGRLRAIILTSVTTVIGIFPMAYSVGGESGFTQPLAFSMGWGLSFATLLTLFLLPALMVIYLDCKNLFGRLRRKGKLEASLLSPPAPPSIKEERPPELFH